MRENRELLDNVTERLRSITSELEHTGRGDLKHLHLRQQEYDTIQVRTDQLPIRHYIIRVLQF